MTTGNITLTRLTVVVVAQNDSQKLLDTMDRIYDVSTDDTLAVAKAAYGAKFGLPVLPAQWLFIVPPRCCFL